MADVCTPLDCNENVSDVLLVMTSIVVLLIASAIVIAELVYVDQDAVAEITAWLRHGYGLANAECSHLREILAEQRVARIRKIFVLTRYFRTGILSTVAIAFVVTHFRDLNSKAASHLLFTTPLVSIIFWHALIHAVSRRPELLNAFSCDIIYMTMATVTAIRVMIAPATATEFLMTCLWTTPQRFVWGFVFNRLPVTVVANAMMSFAYIFYSFRIDNVSGELPPSVRLPTCVAREVCISTMVCASVWFLESCDAAELRARIEVRRESLEKSAVNTLLAGLCDAVVLLDQEHRILEASPQLSALLLSKATTLPGKDFACLLDGDGEQQRFREHMARASESEVGDGQIHAKALHITLRDSCGAPVRVRILHALVRNELDAPPSTLMCICDGEAYRHAPPELEEQSMATVEVRAVPLLSCPLPLRRSELIIDTVAVDASGSAPLGITVAKDQCSSMLFIDSIKDGLIHPRHRIIN